jgi:ubiquinone/menaquinone biosynthesis C-methylase UbiE
VGLAREAEGPVLELAVGDGRVAVPVAQATGRPVIGIDSSQGMLEQARARAVQAGVELDLREGDMREFADQSVDAHEQRAGATPVRSERLPTD